jgi:DNA-binding NarL/FixJ family response regulator
VFQDSQRNELGEDKMNTLQVLLIDDHEIFRKSVAFFLSEQDFVEIVGEPVNGDDAIAL